MKLKFGEMWKTPPKNLIKDKTTFLDISIVIQYKYMGITLEKNLVANLHNFSFKNKSQHITN